MTRRQNCIFASTRGDARGFSLIELVAVTVITGALAAVAIPSFTALAASRTAYGTRQIVRDISYARERAVSTGTRTWVVFNVALNRYSVLAENPASPGRAGAMVLSDPANTGTTYLQVFGTGAFSGVTINSATFDAGSEIGFDWLGGPLNVSETALAVQGTVTLNSGYSVTVQPLTGLTR